MIVDGQVHGGIAQGVAQALWEGAVYDEDGQLQTASMMDYALPKAEFFPHFEVDRTETPTDVNPLGVKGAGETGTIASTPAVVNAVVDALVAARDRALDMPLTPERVWRAIAAGEGLRRRHVHDASCRRSPTTGPPRVEEAVSLLDELDDARPLAGGHSLLPAMKLRLSTPAALVDIGRIPGLDAIEPDGDGLRIGALATHAEVASSEAVRSVCPVLGEAAALIGDRQVRNRGTIGGSLAHADPGADYPDGASPRSVRPIAVTGPRGAREIPADDFFTGIFTTALEPGELITSVHVPMTGAGTGAAYIKHKHPASGYAVAAVAALVTVERR